MKQILLMIAVVALVGCGGNPNKKANELFVEAVQLITSAEEQTGEAAIKDYEQALGKLEKIIANYSESDLAVKLIAGETLFKGESLEQIKQRVNKIKAAREAVKGWLNNISIRDDSSGQEWYIKRYNATTGEMVQPYVEWETATARMVLFAKRGAWANGMWVFYDVELQKYEPPTNDLPSLIVVDELADKQIAGSPERIREIIIKTISPKSPRK